MSKFTSTRHLSRHHKLRHKVIEPQNRSILSHNEAADTPDYHDEEFISFDLIEPALHPAFSSNVERSASKVVNSSYDMRKLFISATSTYYFTDELSNGESSGVKRLVMNSQFGCASSFHNINSTDVARELRMAKYIYKMKKDQRICFPVIVKDIIEVALKQFAQNNNFNNIINNNGCDSNGVNNKITNESIEAVVKEIAHNNSSQFTLPTCYAKLRSMYTEGKHAIIPNLPSPSVIKVCRHSYMSLREAVAHHLAFATAAEITAFDDLNSGIKNLLCSKRSKELFQKAQEINHSAPTIPVFFTKWANDFESNSQAKQNRGSGWCFSITFVLPTNCQRRSTYIISLGEKGWDHTPIHVKFLEELRSLQGGGVHFYHAGLKRVVLVHVDVIAILQDQPERRKGVFVSMGNSRFTARWGYSADLRGMFTKLPPCESCKLKLISGDTNQMSSIITCNVCASFDYSRSDLLCTDPQDDYPMDAAGTDNLLDSFSYYPKRLDFSKMSYAVRIAIEKIHVDAWSTAQATVYLATFGLNNDIISSVLKDNFADVDNLLPCTWQEVANFSYLVDVYMHLLGLGIAKSVNKFLLRSWLVNRKLLSSFLRTSNPMLLSVKDLHLEWCKILSSGHDQKLGGWVSENHFGWTRISRWLYKDIDMLRIDQPYFAPIISVSRYTVSQCKAWLTAHGIRFKASDKVSILRQLIKNAQSDEASPPTLVAPCGGSVLHVENVIKSLSAVMSACMGPSECTIDLPDAVDCYIKLFLSAVDELDKHRPAATTTVDPIWVSSYNFTSLLNVPDAMREYGMPRFLWEGGAMGEGILRRIKPLINGLKRGWNLSAHTRYQTVMALEQVSGISSDLLIDETVDANAALIESSDEPVSTTYKLYDYYKYGSIEKVHESLQGSKPLSGLILEGGTICIATNAGRVLWQIHLSATNCHRFGLWYHEIVLSEECLSEKFRTKSVSTYCLLLPLCSLPSSDANDEAHQHMYCIITKDWREISENRCLEYCRGVCSQDLVNNSLEQQGDIRSAIIGTL
jgi:hypothetical protein